MPGILTYLFATTPALARWATARAVGQRHLSGPPGNDRDRAQPDPATAGADGHVVAMLTFWRPQRKAIVGSGEGTGWIASAASATAPTSPTARRPEAGCAWWHGQGPLRRRRLRHRRPELVGHRRPGARTAADRPADPANQLTFSVDITRCLTNGGVTWNAGETLAVDVPARSNYGDNAAPEGLLQARLTRGSRRRAPQARGPSFVLGPSARSRRRSPRPGPARRR